MENKEVVRKDPRRMWIQVSNSNKVIDYTTYYLLFCMFSNLYVESITYQGISFSQAAAEGNLPLCVLLWGMASAKRVNLITPDSQGCNPLHHAAMAETTEVSG